MLPVSLPVLVCGLLTCLLLEKFRLFGYGEPLPPTVCAKCYRISTIVAVRAAAVRIACVLSLRGLLASG